MVLWNRRLLVLLCAGLVLAGCRSPEPELLPVKLEGVVVDPQTGSPVLFLVDEASGRGIPVWIGVNEARTISMELQGISAPRPLTHDLLKRILDLLDARVERVVISDIRDNTYFAVLSIGSGNQNWEIDCRPSDAIALALKGQAPIYISRKLREKGVFVDLGSASLGAPVEERLGFAAQDLSPELAEYFGLRGKRGAILTDVVSGSPAERAGLRKGDVVLLVEGESVQGIEDLRRMLEEKESKKGIRMEVHRSGKAVSVKLRPGSKNG